MSALTFEHKPFASDWHVPAVLKRLFEGSGKQGQLYTELKDLPDHLLLDIGVDPRSAPLSLNEAIARPDLVNGGVVRTYGRIVARS